MLVKGAPVIEKDYFYMKAHPAFFNEPMRKKLNTWCTLNSYTYFCSEKKLYQQNQSNTLWHFEVQYQLGTWSNYYCLYSTSSNSQLLRIEYFDEYSVIGGIDNQSPWYFSYNFDMRIWWMHIIILELDTKYFGFVVRFIK